MRETSGSVKRILLVLGFCGILILCVVITITINKQTPYDYLKKSNNDVTAPSELLYQETLETGLSVIFYIDQKGIYECAIIRDTLLGYKTIGVSGSLGVHNNGTYLYSSFSGIQTSHNICWGILTDNDITEVFLDNAPCNIADTSYNFRIFWLMDLGNDNPILTTKS